MATEKMTREQVEEAIMEHMQAIYDLHKAYNPDGDYVGMYILKGYMRVNNSYWDKDKKAPIDVSRGAVDAQ